MSFLTQQKTMAPHLLGRWKQLIEKCFKCITVTINTLIFFRVHFAKLLTLIIEVFVKSFSITTLKIHSFFYLHKRTCLYFSVIVNTMLHVLIYSFYISIFLYMNQAEVQSVFTDGSLSLHTRSLKYGKVCERESFNFLAWIYLLITRIKFPFKHN